MANYTLKLTADNTTNYRLYSGGTLVSDADITTLFATAGEAYFTVDLDSLTPTNLTALNIINSTDTVVVSNTGLTLVDGKNFKGTWGNSATSFTSFAELAAYGLDESQLAQLVGKIPSAGGFVKVITVDDSMLVNRTYKFNEKDPGWYLVTGTCSVFWELQLGVSGKTQNTSGWSSDFYEHTYLIFIYTAHTSNAKSAIVFLDHNLSGQIFRGEISETTSTAWSKDVGAFSHFVANNLTTYDSRYVLSARQGQTLNNHIGNLSNLTTTDKTSTVAAINELEARIAALEGN